MERMRARFEAKQVTATRFFAAFIMRFSVTATSPSEWETPSRMELVESQISARHPCAPISRKRFSSIGLPMTGSGSIFQSPE